MAKKMLINADMLLATPRRAEAPVAPPTPEKVENTVVEEVVSVPATPSVQEVIKDIPQVNKVSIMTPELPVSISSVQKGLKIGETRATFIIQEEYLDKIKAVAYWDRKNIKEVMNAALLKYIAEYEAQNGIIQPIP